MTINIFVSHATKNDDIVSEIVSFLSKNTPHDFWVDHFNLQPPEANWRTAIQDALESCDAGLLVLSRDSVQRDEIVAEWNYLLNTQRPLYIIKIDDVPIADIDYRLHLVQWLDMTSNRDRALSGLAAALRGEQLQDETPVLLMRSITGRIDHRLLAIPIRGRDYGLEVLAERLREAPTLILGMGGIGKSRLAAQLAMSSADINRTVWLNCTQSTTPDDLLALLRQHLDLAADTSQHDTLRKLHQTSKVLVVLDGAERIPEGDSQAAFVELIEELFGGGAQVLLTSRADWDMLHVRRTYRPQRPRLNYATQIVLDMATAFDVGHNLDDIAEQLAEAAYRHPVLMEWAVKQCRHFSPKQVIGNLSRLKSKTLRAAMDDIVHKTIRQMVRAEGTKPREALRYLVVCRAGFTYDAVDTLLHHLDETERYACVHALVSWQFMQVTPFDGDKRYWVDDLVIEVVDAAEDAAARHLDYYRKLAAQCVYDGDYATLAPEIRNLIAARAHDDSFAAWLEPHWADILDARRNT